LRLGRRLFGGWDLSFGQRNREHAAVKCELIADCARRM
jgi:hypothetical protein